MVAVVPSGSSRAGNRAAQKKPRVSGAEYFGGTSNLPQMRPVDENVVSTNVWARCVTTITQKCAFLQGAELDRAAPTLTCGMTGGIVRCTSMQRPRRAAWQRNGWRTVKGAICLQRAVEGPIVNYPRASSYTPNPRSPEGFWNPA